MALEDWKLQAIEEANQINQSPGFNWRSMLGFGNTNQAQDVTYPNQLQDESFSDRRYEDTGNVHGPRSFPQDTSAINYNIHRDPPRDWREDYQGTYGAPTAPLFSSEPTMMNLKRDGIMKTDQAQKKGFDFSKLSNFLPGGILRGIMSNFRDSPQEAFNREYFPTADRGGSKRVNYNPASNVFGNKNVSYAFGPGLEVVVVKLVVTALSFGKFLVIRLICVSPV